MTGDTAENGSPDFMPTIDLKKQKFRLRKKLKTALVNQFPTYDPKLMVYWATKSSKKDLRCNNQGRGADSPDIEKEIVSRLTGENCPLIGMKARNVRSFIIKLANEIRQNRSELTNKNEQSSTKNASTNTPN